MFLDYRIMPGKAPVPVIAFGGARVVGARNILLALARKTGRFLGNPHDTEKWLAMAAEIAASPAMLEEQLATQDFILGDYSVADMAAYPLLLRAQTPAGLASVARWAARMAMRPAAGRGLGVIAG
jgi:glutathione S-transferase